MYRFNSANKNKFLYNNKFSVDLYSLQFSQASYKDFVIEDKFLEDIGNSLVSFDKTYPVRIEFTATNAKLGYYLKGNISYKLASHCSRCLENLSEKVQKSQFTAFFVDEIDKNNDCGVYKLYGNVANLEPIIFDTIGLSIDYSPICSEDCKGLCAFCGINLNANSKHKC
ncbi:MAG: DUF177 domain-containing protein [Bifidobacteriaceae bacterium]|jgi:uncharacterized protein|nr:DUF177 domain-containing protein [Bifidobacteriaceae bacterium]